MPRPVRALPVVPPRDQPLTSVTESTEPHVWPRGLTAAGIVFGHLRPSERWGPVASSGKDFATCPEGSSLEASAQGWSRGT